MVELQKLTDLNCLHIRFDTQKSTRCRRLIGPFSHFIFITECALIVTQQIRGYLVVNEEVHQILSQFDFLLQRLSGQI